MYVCMCVFTLTVAIVLIVKLIMVPLSFKKTHITKSYHIMLYSYNTIIAISTTCSPMDFLIAPRHRWIYVAIFSVMAVSAFQIFQRLNNFNVSANLYLNLFLKMCKFPT